MFRKQRDVNQTESHQKVDQIDLLSSKDRRINASVAGSEAGNLNYSDLLASSDHVGIVEDNKNYRPHLIEELYDYWSQFKGSVWDHKYPNFENQNFHTYEEPVYFEGVATLNENINHPWQIEHEDLTKNCETLKRVKEKGSLYSAPIKKELTKFSYSPREVAKEDSKTIIENKVNQILETNNRTPWSDVKDKKSSSHRSLALRPDVMNKNVLRALRREAKELFESFLESKGMLPSKNMRVFSANLHKFSSNLLNSTEIGSRLSGVVDAYEFEIYVGMFVNTCLMKKKLVKAIEQKKYNQFNELLYSYSHTKFEEFLNIPEVSILIRVLIEKCNLDQFIASNPALAANSDEYKSHVERILQQ